MEENLFSRIGSRLRDQRRNLLDWWEATPATRRAVRLGPLPAEALEEHRRVLDDAIEKADRGDLGLCTVCHEHVESHWLETNYTTSVCIEHLSGEERTRLESELELSQKVQKALLPRTVPSIEGWGIAAFSQPASIVGGDYFDFMKFRDGARAVIIADVMGKGMPASLLMASLQAALSIIVPESMHPHEVLGRVNVLFCHNIQLTKFVSIVILRIEPESRTLQYANAGHHPPLLVPAGASPIRLLRPTGAAIGLVESAGFRSADARTDPGDLLLLYTDGVVEAENGSREEYGEDRLKLFLERQRQATPPEVIRALRDSLDRHRGGAPLSDDTTMLACRRTA